MQRTRLSTLANVTSSRFNSFFGNPWRRLSLQIICVLFGVFSGQAIVTSNVNGIKIARFWNPEKSQLVLRIGISVVLGYCQLSSLALPKISG